MPFLKSLSEKIEWYCQKEQRLWKRIYHLSEIVFISISALVLAVLVQIYGSGNNLQSAVVAFIIIIALSSILLAPTVLKSVSFNRWQTQVITLGLGSGVGISAICTLFLFELQLVGT